MIGPPEQLVPIVLQGLMGPLDGKNYQAGYMAPAEALHVGCDKQISQILSYLRFAWDHGMTDSISPDDVKKIRQAHPERKTPWTQEELENL